MLRRTVPLVATLLFACGSSSSGGAAKQPANVVVLAVSSDLAMPGDLDVFEIQVQVDQSAVFDVTYNLPTDAVLPGTLTLVTDGDATGAPKGTLMPGVAPIGTGKACTVTVRAKHGATEVVSRVATFDLAGAFSKKLAIPLEKACLSVACAAGQTCIAGACAATAVSLASLPAPLRAR